MTFRALALSLSNWGNCGLCVGLYVENGAIHYWWEYADEKTRIN